MLGTEIDSKLKKKARILSVLAFPLFPLPLALALRLSRTSGETALSRCVTTRTEAAWCRGRKDAFRKRFSSIFGSHEVPVLLLLLNSSVAIETASLPCTNGKRKKKGKKYFTQTPTSLSPSHSLAM